MFQNLPGLPDQWTVLIHDHNDPIYSGIIQFFRDNCGHELGTWIEDNEEFTIRYHGEPSSKYPLIGYPGRDVEDGDVVINPYVFCEILNIAVLPPEPKRGGFAKFVERIENK